MASLSGNISVVSMSHAIAALVENRIGGITLHGIHPGTRVCQDHYSFFPVTVALGFAGVGVPDSYSPRPL